jgi:hypothetical protein
MRALGALLAVRLLPIGTPAVILAAVILLGGMSALAGRGSRQPTPPRWLAGTPPGAALGS